MRSKSSDESYLLSGGSSELHIDIIKRSGLG
jgi:hypothetical protein